MMTLISCTGKTKLCTNGDSLQTNPDKQLTLNETKATISGEKIKLAPKLFIFERRQTIDKHIWRR